MAPTPSLLVTGASGQLGRRVVELLLASGHARVFAATRHPEKLADLAQRGALLRRADFDEPASLDAAFEGIDRLLLISTDTLGRRAAQHRAAIDAAARAGVKHVVYTSAPPLPGNAIGEEHLATERMLADSALDWTLLRNNLYTDLLVMGAIGRALASGKLVSAAGDGATAYVTREDCARAAAAALAAPFTGRRTLEISGPDAMTGQRLAAIANVPFVAASREASIADKLASGLPQLYADVLLSFELSAAQGQLANVTTDYEQLTGRKPESVAEFVAAHHEALRAPTLQ